MVKGFALTELADYLGAQWQGDANARVTAIANLERAGPADLAFLSSKKYHHFLQSTRAGIVIVKHDTVLENAQNVLLVEDPYVAYARVSALFSQHLSGSVGVHPSANVDPSASVAESAVIGANCTLGPDCVVGEHTELMAGAVVGAGCSIGSHCLLYPNVVLYHGVTLGDRVRVHSSTVIGSDGFGFAPTKEGWVKIHQLGGVAVGSNVEIGASCTIDRGALDDTVIEDGVIIDNQVHIAHNVRIGRSTAIAGCVGIAGSTTIGARCTIGGFVAIGGHLQIADDVHFNGSTVVTKSITEPGHYSSGTMVQEVKTWRRNAVRFGQLDSWVERIKKLEQADNS